MVVVVGSIATELTADARPLLTSLATSGSKILAFERAANRSYTNFSRDSTRAMSIAAAANDSFAKRLGLGATSIAGLAKGALLAALPVLSLKAAVDGARAALDQFGDIADKSAAAGVDPEFFQGLAYQAKLSGVEIDGVAGALNTYAKNAGLAAEGKGKLVSQLKALDPELLKQIQSATTQEERIRLAADAINDAKNAAQAAALATALFGDQGTKLVAAFQGGSAQIDAMAASAKSMGLIVDRDLISGADALGDRFDTVTQIIDVQLKTALVNLAPVMVGLGGMVADWSKSLGIALDQLKAIEDRQYVRPLQNQLAGVYNERSPLGDKIDAEKSMIARLGPDNPASATAGMELAADQKRFDDLTEQAQQLLGRVQELQGLGETTPDVASGVTSPTFPSSSDVTARNDAARAALQQASAVEQLIQDLQFEKSLIGKTEVEQQTMNALRQAGAAATDEQKAQIASLIGDIDAQSAAYDNLQSAMAGAQDFAGQLVDGLFSGKSAVETLSDAVGDLEKSLLKLAMNRAIEALFNSLSSAFLPSVSGDAAIPTGGFYPGLTGPRLAGGGPVNGKGTSTSDSIHAMLSDGEFVMNAAATKKNRRLLEMLNSGFDGVLALASGGPASRHPTAGPNVDVNSLDPQVNLQIINMGPPVDTKGQKTSKGPNGGTMKQILVGPLKQAFAGGTMDGLMKSLYGIERKGV
ncbi:MAG TPA: hypothetical protein VGM83_05825 [Devosiaceae bacterium]|jgi:hypothetical protein